MPLFMLYFRVLRTDLPNHGQLLHGNDNLPRLRRGGHAESSKRVHDGELYKGASIEAPLYFRD